jgi:predicted membrane-bound mannosyltransferase
LNQYIFFAAAEYSYLATNGFLSITQRYFQDKTSFCEPEIYNHLADGGHTGKSAGEFPGWYYLMAQFWKLFGKHEWLYRAMVFVVFSGACLALFKMAIRTTQNIALSIFFSLLLFTSPTIAYYSISFLTNIPALSL